MEVNKAISEEIYPNNADPDVMECSGVRVMMIVESPIGVHSVGVKFIPAAFDAREGVASVHSKMDEVMNLHINAAIEEGLKPVLPSGHHTV